VRTKRPDEADSLLNIEKSGYMSFVRLSQSGLWDRLREYYDENGVTAWSTGTIPHYITNSPLIANAYADLITAHLDDLARSGALDQNKPVYVVEMGGGSGRLAFYILRRLQARQALLPVKVCYVLTDFTKTNVDHWRQHPSFAPFLSDGTLDLACFDVENDSTLELESGAMLDGKGNPVFFLANYLFDSLTQDCFRINEGALEEALPEIVYEEAKPTISYSYQQASETPYERQDYDLILSKYTGTLGDTSLLFPVGPLKCLENLLQMSGNRACLIAADKAWVRWEDLVSLGEPAPSAHGPGFSMTVNFHAMGLWWENLGGQVFHNVPRDSLLKLSCFCLGLADDALPRTRAAFEDKLDHFGPMDFFNLKNVIEPLEEKNLRLCIELMRLSYWDPDVLYALADSLVALPGVLSTLHKRELSVALTRSWENHFPIGEDRDLAFEIARVFFRLEFFEQALHFYGESTRIFGEHNKTYHNMGLCFYFLRRLEESKKMFEKSLSLDPGHGVSREWLLQLAPEIEESGTFPGVL
jgi:tetratricopeptide (TPR) repeat protein